MCAWNRITAEKSTSINRVYVDDYVSDFFCRKYEQAKWKLLIKRPICYAWTLVHTELVQEYA